MSAGSPRTPLDVELVRRALAGRSFGRRVEHRLAVDSTNRLALALAREGAAEGTVVLAEEQTHGRGRGEHAWLSTRGLGLYLSLLLRPDRALFETAVFGLVGGVAAACAVRETTGLRARIKWPNDVLCRDRKVGGILAEASTGPAAGPAVVVVGIGINVHHEPAELPEGTPVAPTSLRLEGAAVPSRAALAVAVVRHAERLYTALQSAGVGPFEEELVSLWVEKDAWVVLEEGPAAGQEGRASRLDLGAGRLVLVDESGRESPIPLDRFVRLRRTGNSEPIRPERL
ncbi:MAG: biotin--[acetyl-CoA-carboxylase] ligase [Planctomycetes bacterium]|nr:biotin--[acetyl-CoA-carboxylase] ligase [Planctomycetota bacterium]